MKATCSRSAIPDRDLVEAMRDACSAAYAQFELEAAIKRGDLDLPTGPRVFEMHRLLKAADENYSHARNKALAYGMPPAYRDRILAGRDSFR